MLVTRFAYIKMADHRNENNNDQSVNIDGELSESAQNILKIVPRLNPTRDKQLIKRQKPTTLQKATKLNKANDNHVAGYHTLSDQAHDKLSKQSGAKSTKGPT
jgi:hypothetical protein